MKLLLLLTSLPLLQAKSFSPSSPRTPGGCSSMTVGGCEPSAEHLVDTYPLPNSDTAVEACQSICQVQEGCNYFTYNSQEEECFLYQYRYLYNCQIRGASATPSMEECSQRIEDSWNNNCDSFARENCQYGGNEVLRKEFITDAHSCQRLLSIIGVMLNAEYFVYDYSQHTCIFYDSDVNECDSISGPDLPNMRECNERISETAQARKLDQFNLVNSFEELVDLIPQDQLRWSV